MIKVGEIGIDSGRLSIQDIATQYHGYDILYDNFLDRQCAAGFPEVFIEGDTFTFSTGYGDGSYPIYVEYDKDGRVMKILIDFTDTEEEQLDDDERFTYDDGI